MAYTNEMESRNSVMDYYRYKILWARFFPDTWPMERMHLALAIKRNKLVVNIIITILYLQGSRMQRPQPDKTLFTKHCTGNI